MESGLAYNCVSLLCISSSKIVLGGKRTKIEKIRPKVFEIAMPLTLGKLGKD